MSLFRELIDPEGTGRLPRSRAGIAAFALTAAGFLLGATVDQLFLVLAAAGLFGPNLQRELGWLRDRDEWQTAVARRAAMHGYLFGGLITIAVVISIEAGSTDFDDSAYSAVTLLFAYLVPYLFSYLTSFWGATASARRILLAFGTVWLLFNVLGNLKDPLALVMQCLVAVPFFALAWSCRRFPRSTGGLLLAAAVASFVLFDLERAFVSPEHFSALAVTLLFPLPLAYSGITLLGVRHDKPED